MAELLDPKELVAFKALLMSEVIQLEALANLLDKKGIISKQELLEEMKRVKATLPKSEGMATDNKRMSQITKEEAVEIAGNHAGPLSFTGITDKYGSSWVIYGADDMRTNCWYVTFRPSVFCCTTGASYMVAVSKKDGSILYSGSTGD